MNRAPTSINSARPDARAEMVHACAGSWSIARAVASHAPFSSWEDLASATSDAWNEASEADVREAASHHPRIGADRAALRAKFASTADWSSAEQQGVAGASEAILDALAEANESYVAKFGYTFIVCATGKSATEMLDIVRARIPASPEQEWKAAREELRKITLIRLQKLEP